MTMSTRRRIEITMETEQVIKSGEGPGQESKQWAENCPAWCAQCTAHVLMINAEQAARLSGMSLRQLVRCADTAAFHFAEPGDGGLLICLASLSGWLRRCAAPTEPVLLLAAAASPDP